ncbi:hypothetical protein [Streptomyces sp. NPDC047868]
MPSDLERSNESQPALHSVEAEPGVLVHTSSVRRLAAEHWMLSTHPTPRRARLEWQEHGVAVLPLGTLFSAVRVPGRLVQAVAASTDLADIDAVLDEVLDGPVICDVRGPRYYALVPAGVPRTYRQAVEDWQAQEVECLGRGAYLGVPRLDMADYPEKGTRSYWSVPMESAAVLCKPLAVARLIAAGVHELAENPGVRSADASLTPQRSV